MSWTTLSGSRVQGMEGVRTGQATWQRRSGPVRYFAFWEEDSSYRCRSEEGHPYCCGCSLSQVSTWTLSGVLDDIEEAVQAEEALSCPPPCSVAQVWKGCASGRCSARFTPHLGAVLVFFAIVAFVIGALLTHL